MIDFTQMQAFSEDPLILTEGDGIRVRDVDGRWYIDGLSGTFCMSLGHGNARVVGANLLRASYVPSASGELTRCPPRTSTNAFMMAPRSSPARLASASSRCSTATYSSLSVSASVNAASSVSRSARDAGGVALPPSTRGRREIRSSAAARTAAAESPAFSSTRPATLAS